MTILGTCKNCGENRKIFYNGMCQSCYRKSTKTKKDKQLYSIYKGYNDRIRKATEMLVSKKCTRKHIAQTLNYNISTVNKIYILYIREREWHGKSNKV